VIYYGTIAILCLSCSSSFASVSQEHHTHSHTLAHTRTLALSPSSVVVYLLPSARSVALIGWLAVASSQCTITSGLTNEQHCVFALCRSISNHTHKVAQLVTIVHFLSCLRLLILTGALCSLLFRSYLAIDHCQLLPLRTASCGTHFRRLKPSRIVSPPRESLLSYDVLELPVVAGCASYMARSFSRLAFAAAEAVGTAAVVVVVVVVVVVEVLEAGDAEAGDTLLLLLRRLGDLMANKIIMSR
jgi:hypothetical protein